MIRKKNAKCINGFKVIASERSSNGLSSNSLLWHHFSCPAQIFQGLSLNWEKRKKIYFVPRGSLYVGTHCLTINIGNQRKPTDELVICKQTTDWSVGYASNAWFPRAMLIYVPFDGMFVVILFEKNKRKSKSQVYMTHYRNGSAKNIMVFSASANVMSAQNCINHFKIAHITTSYFITCLFQPLSNAINNKTWNSPDFYHLKIPFLGRPPRVGKKPSNYPRRLDFLQSAPDFCNL